MIILLLLISIINITQFTGIFNFFKEIDNENDNTNDNTNDDNEYDIESFNLNNFYKNHL